MDIQWKTSVPASGFYAAGQMLRGVELSNLSLSSSLSKPVDRLRIACETWQVSAVDLVDQLTAITAEAGSLQIQVETAICKFAGLAAVERLRDPVTAAAQQVVAGIGEVSPQLAEELELRVRPLLEQWEAYGPGLVFQLKKTLGPLLIAERAEVTLVYPATGGGGVAHAAYNRVSFEAVLANTFSGLPEVVRLAWLLAQLQFELPTVQGGLPRGEVRMLALLAVLPAVLSAASELEITRPLEAALPEAAQTWGLGAVQTATLLAWWETYLAERPSWPTALAALAAMQAANDSY